MMAPVLLHGLIASVADRDEEAWAVLDGTCRSSWLSLARRVTGDAAIAEDAVQEAVLVIRRESPGFQPPAAGDPARAAEAWMLAIVANTARNHARAEERRRRRHRAVDPPAGAEDPAEAAVRRDQSALVRGALAALPGPTRDLIALRFWADLSHGEIAIATGLREDAVRQRIHRALQDLRRRLARVGVALSVAGVSAALESAELAATRTVPPLVAGTGMALPAAGAAALVLVTGSWWWLGHPSSGPAPSADPTTAAVAVPAPVPDPPWSLTIAADRHGITGFGSDGTRVLGMALPPDPGAPAFLLLGPDGRRRVERSGPGGGVRWPVDRPEDIAALPPWIREQLAPALSASTQPGDGPDASEALALAGLHTVSIHLAASATGALSLRAIEDGGVVFDGPIDTPDQRRGIPPRVLAHLLDGSPDFIAVGPRLGPGGVDSRSYSEHRPLPVQ